MSGLQNSGYLSSRRVALSISAFQNAMEVEQEVNEAVEQLPSPGSVKFVAPEYSFRCARRHRIRG